MAEKLVPGNTVAILGGGQLGRMLALAAARLGLKTAIYSDEPHAPAFDVASSCTVGAYTHQDEIAAFARDADVVTCEFENVPAEALHAAGRSAPVFPPPLSFAVAQDRWQEKTFLSGLGIAVAPFANIESADQLHAALARVGLPALLKTRRFGYDGKGQMLVRNQDEAEAAFVALGGVSLIAEGLVGFDREISILVVRGQDGTTRFYDAVENVHQDGILATSRAPAPIPLAEVEVAKTMAAKIADALGHVGVLCVEMFMRDGQTPSLLVNEIAPRVHNSGHWTIDACVVSQFENHIRAICGWPLGDTVRHSDAIMTNLIGDDIESWRTLAAEPATAVHLYGKNDARPGRKMGHLTRLYPKR